MKAKYINPYTDFGFKKLFGEEAQLENHFDKWLYFLKHLEDFEQIPGILNEEVFIKAFDTAEIANFAEKQLREYEESLKIYRDMKGAMDTSFEEGGWEFRRVWKCEIIYLAPSLFILVVLENLALKF